MVTGEGGVGFHVGKTCCNAWFCSGFVLGFGVLFCFFLHFLNQVVYLEIY